MNTYEITSVQIKDYVIEAVRSSCKQYIGRKNTTNVISDITYTINTILGQFVNRVIIESYTGLSVERSTDDPRAVNVSFKIKPIYSLTCLYMCLFNKLCINIIYNYKYINSNYLFI